MRAEFELFDRANPRVWELFKHFAFEAIAAGHKHFSADLVIARVRWETRVNTRTLDGFKVNDHYVAFYARKFQETFPEHEGFFRTRRQRSEDRLARRRMIFADQVES